MNACPDCGQVNEPGANFCSSCGVFLEWEDDAVEEPVPAELLSHDRMGDGPGGVHSGSGGTADTMVDGPMSVMGPSGPADSTHDGTGPRTPGQQVQRRERSTTLLAPSRPAEPGDIICEDCGEANIPSRHFCRRCAVELHTEVVPQTRPPWWRRLFGPRPEKEFLAGDRPKGAREAGEPRLKVVWRRLKKIGRTISRVLLAIFMIVALLVPFVPGAAPVRDRVVSYLEGVGTSVQRVVAPRFVEVNPIAARSTSSLPGHPAEQAVDGFSNRHWAEGAPGTGAGEVLSILFESPVDLDRVGFINGGVEEGAEFISQPRPRLVTLSFTDGTEAELELLDEDTFQEFDITGRLVDRVDIRIDTVYGSLEGTSASISEVQFFRKQ